ncbi:MAG: hypothetical protein BGN87_06160 [Rhizobiales bacterium 65-79]|jgi:hypothetical protein|nr:hypothetical protein [Hyphomicrobiales bacterium]OJU02777.1 MAG: hypothetical protein BGN87_06160 [Rhizobiales bacterium 65-79]
MLKLSMAAGIAAALVLPGSAATLRFPFERPQSSVPMTPIPVQGCCKVCHKGKACGNTCIARDRECHAGAGCACDG